MADTEFNPTLLVIGVSIALAMAVMVALRPQAARWVVALMFFATCIGEISQKAGATVGGWFAPVQAVRSEIYLGAGLVLILGLLLNSAKISMRHTSSQIWWLLAITFYQSLLRMQHDTVYDGLTTLGGAAVTILPLLLLLPILYQTRENWIYAIRAVGLAQVLWLGVSVVQFALDPSRLIIGWHSRFIGAAGNPQYAAVVLSITTVILLWLVMNDRKKSLSLLWLGSLGLNLIFLIGTGSRMGVVMATLGVVALLYRRLGRAVLIIPMVAIATWAAFTFIVPPDVVTGYERVMSLEDTRTGVFMELYGEGMENPLLGRGMIDTQQSENSYLLAFAAFGIGCVALMVIFTVVSFFHCLKLWRISFRLRETRPYIDLILGFNAMYFAGAMLEGHILARAIPTLTGLLIFASMSAVILRQYKDGELEEISEQTAEEESVQWDPDPPEVFTESAY